MFWGQVIGNDRIGNSDMMPLHCYLVDVVLQAAIVGQVLNLFQSVMPI